jgi:hypothetical protein
MSLISYAQPFLVKALVETPFLIDTNHNSRRFTWSLEGEELLGLWAGPGGEGYGTPTMSGGRGSCCCWVRDMDFDEYRSQVRTAAGPRIMASLRNLVITILRLAGATNIAAALRYHARRLSRPLQTLTTC